MRRLVLRPLVLCSALLAAAVPVAAQGPLELRVFHGDSTAFFVTSAVIAGPTEMLLVDAQMRDAEAERLAERIANSGRRLTGIFVTHADHDHTLGLVVFHRRFPDVPIWMTAAALAEYRRTAAKIFASQRPHSPQWSNDSIPPASLVPSAKLLVDGQEVQILADLQGDAYIPSNSAVYIPSLQAVVAGDILFSGIHPWLGTSTTRTRAAWLRSIDRIAALRARIVVPGHLADPTLQSDPASIAFTREYLTAFAAVADTATTPDVLANAMRTRYPALAMANFPVFAARIAVPNP